MLVTVLVVSNMTVVVKKVLPAEVNLILVNRSAFDNLMQDDVFIDYLNKFMSLPVFGQRAIYSFDFKYSEHRLKSVICELLAFS